MKVLGVLPFISTASQSDIDSLASNGVYYFSSLTIGSISNKTCTLIQFQWATSKNNLCQIVIFKQAAAVCIRFKSNNAWENWITFTGQQ